MLCGLALGGMGVVYAIDPSWFIGKFMKVGMAYSLGNLPVDMRHLFRALGGIYIGVGLFWIQSAFSGSGLDAGIKSVSIICAGVAALRLISFVFDGQPSNFFVVSTVGEAVLFPLALMLGKE